MTGVIATGLAVAVIATLMVIGIKIKLPPPDPDWREHLPPPPPRPSRGWLVLLFEPLVGFFVSCLAVLVAALLGNERLTNAMSFVFIAFVLLSGSRGR